MINRDLIKELLESQGNVDVDIDSIDYNNDFDNSNVITCLYTRKYNSETVEVTENIHIFEIFNFLYLKLNENKEM